MGKTKHLVAGLLATSLVFVGMSSQATASTMTRPSKASSTVTTLRGTAHVAATTGCWVSPWFSTYYHDFGHDIWEVFMKATWCHSGSTITSLSRQRDHDTYDPLWSWVGWTGSGGDTNTRWDRGEFQSCPIFCVHDDGRLQVDVHGDGTFLVTGSNTVRIGQNP
jgi:hypothetical protein